MAAKQSGQQPEQKQYRVTRPFRHVDYRTGEATAYEPGDEFIGDIRDYHLSPVGPDGHGPLLADPSAETDADADAAADTDHKEN